MRWMCKRAVYLFLSMYVFLRFPGWHLKFTGTDKAILTSPRGRRWMLTPYVRWHIPWMALTEAVIIAVIWGLGMWMVSIVIMAWALGMI